MLSKNQLRFVQSLQLKKNREEHKLFIVEGEKSVIELLKSADWEVDSLFYTEDFLGKITVPLKSQTYEVTPEELKKLSGLQAANNVIAIVKQKEPSKKDLAKGLSIILDDIRDPGNLGTIIRIADWFGVANVICSLSTVDLYNPKTIQATMGSFLRVNVSYTDIKELVKENNNKIPVYATLLHGKNIYQENLPSDAWVIIGNEANGISEEVKQMVTNHLTIPSFSIDQEGAESLNAAIATAIVCSEWRGSKFK